MEIAPGKKLPVKNFPANESKTRKEGLQLDALIESLAEDGIDQDRIDGLINALEDQLELLLVKKLAFLKVNLSLIFKNSYL